VRRPIPGKRDRLRQLRAFCTAARLRSLSAAAEHLGLTQPAVSLQVRELEHELGAVLLDRARAGVTASAAGERLYAHAAPLVGAVDAVFDDLHASIDDADAAPQVRLGASGMCAAFLLPPYLARFRERHRAVALRLETVPVDEGLALLRDEAVDFVVASAVPDAGEAVDYHALLASRLVLIVPLGHPLAARERVAAHEAAAYRFVVPTRAELEHLQQKVDVGQASLAPFQVEAVAGCFPGQLGFDPAADMHGVGRDARRPFAVDEPIDDCLDLFA